MRSLLIGLVAAALMAFLVALSLQGAPVPVWRHVLFAMGVMPLILGAMLYFVPVLTRTSPAQGIVLLVPVASLLLGVGAVLCFKWLPGLLPVIAALALTLITSEAAWAWQRRTHVFGAAHPGLDWYLGALVVLMLALALIVSRQFWPGGWTITRLLHLHLNLFGFLGLTAIGTLRVLLPTVLNTQDPAAMQFLRRQLPIALAGTFAIAIGAAYWPPLATLGALLWMWPSLAMLDGLRRYRPPTRVMQGAGTALAAAVIGWLLVLCAGIAHGYGRISADTALACLVYLFLLPLVTGASSHLLPVWRWPGRISSVHVQMRKRLTAQSGLRVLAFWSSAVLTFADVGFAPLPAALALAGYLLQVMFSFLRVRPQLEV